MSESKTPLHPILRIKKDAEREVVFHYEKEKRLSKHYSARSPSPSNPLSFFKRGRLPGLLPVLLIALIGLAIFRFFPRAGNRTTIAGFEATLRVLVYGQTLLTSVTFERKAPTPEGSGWPVARVEFSLPDTGQTLAVMGELSGSPVTLRGTMDLSPGEGAQSRQEGAPQRQEGAQSRQQGAQSRQQGAQSRQQGADAAASRATKVTALVTVGNESRSLSQAVPKP